MSMMTFFCGYKKKILRPYFLLFLPTLCYGDIQSTTFNNETFLSKTLQTFAMLAIVIFLIFILAYVMRKVVALRSPAGNAIKISSVLPLGTRERIVLIEVKEVSLLVGVTATTMNVLHVFPSTTKE